MQKIEQLRFLERPGRTLGQASIQWLLAEPRVMTVLPNIYDREQLVEFAAAPDAPALEPAELARIDELYAPQLRHRRTADGLQGHDESTGPVDGRHAFVSAS